MPALKTNGLTPHPDFPRQSYEAINDVVSVNWSKTELYSHFAGAWNAFAYRFQGAVDAGAQFQQSLITHGPHPVPAERYQQERA